jgi:hypothetical protein
MEHDSGLARRGIYLLALMAALAVAVLFVVFRQRNPSPVSAVAARPEPWVALLGSSPSGAFPTCLAWPALGQASEHLPSAPGFQVRYVATVALAVRGSPRVPLDVLGEMLDEQQQLKNFRFRLRDGRVVPDEETARHTVVSALKAYVAWQQHPDAVQSLAADDPRLRAVHAAIDRLAQSQNAGVRLEAEAARAKLRRPQ